MLAARFYGRMDILIEEVPVPEIRASDDVLIEVPFWDGIALTYLTAARDDAAYVQQSTGQQQKLLPEQHQTVTHWA